MLSSNDPLESFPRLLHYPEVSYLPHITEPGEVRYKVVCRKVQVKPSSKIKEGSIKRAGKIYNFSRQVHVDGFDYLDVLISDGEYVWRGYLSHEKSNISRVRASRDDTWSAEKFLTVIQTSLQFPWLMRETLKPTFEKSGDDMAFKLRDRSVGMSESFIQSTIFRRVDLSDNPNPTVNELTEEAQLICTTHFNEAVRAGNLEKMLVYVERYMGNVLVNTRTPTHPWHPLQFAAYHNWMDVLVYLLENPAPVVEVSDENIVENSNENEIDENDGVDCQNTLPLVPEVGPNCRSLGDGLTPFLCAAMRGHTEIGKVLLHHGADIFAKNARGEDALSILIKGEHKEMLRWYCDHDSVMAQQGRAIHGIRDKVIVGMFVAIKPERKEYDSEEEGGDMRSLDSDDSSLYL